MRPRQLTDGLLVILEAALISWTLIFLAEYFGWPLVREAGGNVV